MVCSFEQSICSIEQRIPRCSACSSETVQNLGVCRPSVSEDDRTEGGENRLIRVAMTYRLCSPPSFWTVSLIQRPSQTWGWYGPADNGRQEERDEVAGSANGFIDEFSLNGKFIARIASHGPLDSP
jgi:hypothetical protein